MAITKRLLLSFGCYLIQLASAQNYNTLNYDTGPGLYYENIGEANIYIKDFNMITYYDLERYFTNYRSVGNYSLQVEKVSSGVDFVLRDNFVNLMKQTLTVLEHKHQLIIDIIGNNTATSGRRKRFLSLVFGVATLITDVVQIAETHALASEVRQYRQEVNHIQSMLRNHMFVFQNFQKNVNDRFDSLSEDINRLTQKMEGLTALIMQLRRKSELQALLQYTNNLIQLFSVEQSDLLDCLILARQGALHPMIISPNMLKEKLVEARNRLNYDQHIAKSLETAAKNANTIFNMLKPMIFVVDRTVIFSFNVPLIKESYYDIYKLTPAPVYISDNIYAYLYPEKPYLFVNKEGNRHFFMDKHELDECQIVGVKQYLCKRIKPLRIEKLTCEHSLISSYKEMPKNCDVRLVKIDKTFFIELEREGSWLFIAPKSENLYLYCDNGLEQTVINGTGIVNVNYTCHNTETDFVILRDYSTNNFNLSHYYKIYTPTGNLRKYLEGTDTRYLSSTMNLRILSRYETVKLKDIGSSLQSVQNENELYRHSNAKPHNNVLYFTCVLCTLLFCMNVHLYISYRRILR